MSVFHKPKVRAMKEPVMPDNLNIIIHFSKITRYDAVNDGCGLYQQISGYQVSVSNYKGYMIPESFVKTDSFDTDPIVAIETALGSFMDKITAHEANKKK